MSEVDRETLSEKDKNKLNKIDKLLLKRKLKREKIDISDDDLDIVINTYNHLLDFYLEDNRKHSDYRFAFAFVPKSLYEMEDTNFYWIFHLLIVMKNNNLLHYLDYILLYNSYSIGGSILHELYRFLQDFVDRYRKSNNNPDFIYEYIKKNNFLLEDTIDNYISNINKSKYIPKVYKDIMNLYRELFYLYINDDYYSIDYEAFFQEYVNMTYFYFLINNLFNTEPEEIIKYLNKIKEDIPALCDKLNLDGEMEDKERIKYIDTQYKERNKRKILK